MAMDVVDVFDHRGQFFRVLQETERSQTIARAEPAREQGFGGKAGERTAVEQGMRTGRGLTPRERACYTQRTDRGDRARHRGG
jgi:hypothetical protein